MTASLFCLGKQSKNSLSLSLSLSLSQKCFSNPTHLKSQFGHNMALILGSLIDHIKKICFEGIRILDGPY